MPTIRLGGEPGALVRRRRSGHDRAAAQPRGRRSARSRRGRSPPRARARRPCSCTAGSTTPTPGSPSSTGSPSPVAQRSPTTCPGSAPRRRWAPGRCSTSSSSSPPTRSSRPPRSRAARSSSPATRSVAGLALRLAERDELPLAGVVADRARRNPDGARVLHSRSRPGRLADHRPAGAGAARGRAIGRRTACTGASPSPIPPASTRRSSTGSPAFTSSAASFATGIDYAKRLRDELDDPFDPDLIKVPVTRHLGRVRPPLRARAAPGSSPSCSRTPR